MLFSRIWQSLAAVISDANNWYSKSAVPNAVILARPLRSMSANSLLNCLPQNPNVTEFYYACQLQNSRIYDDRFVSCWKAVSGLLPVLLLI
jgi:hypothetical protein